MKIVNAPSQADFATASAVVTNLNQLLASSYALMANTQFAHWNVEGTNFFALHEAFHLQYGNLFAAIDELAERVRALDAYPIGGLSTFASLAGFEEFTNPMSERTIITGLVAGHRKVATDAVTLRDASIAAQDHETQDIAIGRIQWHDKTIWMLRSFLK